MRRWDIGNEATEEANPGPSIQHKAQRSPNQTRAVHIPLSVPIKGSDTLASISPLAPRASEVGGASLLVIQQRPAREAAMHVTNVFWDKGAPPPTAVEEVEVEARIAPKNA